MTITMGALDVSRPWAPCGLPVFTDKGHTGAMRVVVIGGRGDLGARVVTLLRERGHGVESASRRSGVDLTTGQGVTEAVAGAGAVVLCAMSPLRASAIEITGTEHVIAAARAQDRPPHLVGISIVGCDLSPYPYYRVKTRSEAVLDGSGLPVTVLRATQFHALAAFFAGVRLGRVGLTIGEMAIQSVDIDFVAKRLADIAEGVAPRGYQRATDVAGPQILTAQQVAEAVARHDGRGAPRLLRLPAVGGTMTSFARGDNLPGEEVEIGGLSFEEWLATQPVPLPRGMHHAR